jgi:hypothetical protein
MNNILLGDLFILYIFAEFELRKLVMNKNK